MSYRTTKKITLLALIVALTLCVSSKVFAANTDKAAKPEEAKTPPAAKQEEQKAQPKHDPNEVIAKVGDSVLTRRKVNWMQQDAPPDIVKKIADWWIETELLYKDALKCEEMFNDDMDKYMFDLQFKKMYVRKFVDYLQGKDFEISEEEAKEYYNKNKETDIKLHAIGQSTFTHIEIEKKEKAQELVDKIKEGEDIKDLAKKHSIARDAKQGGYIRKMGFGVIKRRFGPEIAKMVEKVKPGALIGPIENKNGKFEILSIETVKPTEILAFERVQKRINSILLGKKREKNFSDYRENIKKENSDKIYRSPILDEVEEKESEKK